MAEENVKLMQECCSKNEMTQRNRGRRQAEYCEYVEGQVFQAPQKLRTYQ